MKIGLFGGAFDPFHNGHLAICKAAKEKLGLDKLIIIPSGNAPHKAGFSASFEDRYNMISQSVDGLGFTVSDYENKRKEISYSATTVEDFKKKFPNDELYFIIGGDSYRDLDKWYQPHRISENATLAVYPREQAQIVVLPPAVEFKTEKVDVSSTMLREMIKRGEDISSLVPPKAAAYIREHKLYK